MLTLEYLEVSDIRDLELLMEYLLEELLKLELRRPQNIRLMRIIMI